MLSAASIIRQAIQVHADIPISVEEICFLMAVNETAVEKTCVMKYCGYTQEYTKRVQTYSRQCRILEHFGVHHHPADANTVLTTSSSLLHDGYIIFTLTVGSGRPGSSATRYYFRLTKDYNFISSDFCQLTHF